MTTQSSRQKIKDDFELMDIPTNESVARQCAEMEEISKMKFDRMQVLEKHLRLIELVSRKKLQRAHLTEEIRVMEKELDEMDVELISITGKIVHAQYKMEGVIDGEN